MKHDASAYPTREALIHLTPHTQLSVGYCAVCIDLITYAQKPTRVCALFHTNTRSTCRNQRVNVIACCCVFGPVGGVIFK